MTVGKYKNCRVYAHIHIYTHTQTEQGGVCIYMDGWHQSQGVLLIAKAMFNVQIHYLVRLLNWTYILFQKKTKDFTQKYYMIPENLIGLQKKLQTNGFN